MIRRVPVDALVSPGHGCLKLALGMTGMKDGRYPMRSMTTVDSALLTAPDEYLPWKLNG